MDNAVVKDMGILAAAAYDNSLSVGDPIDDLPQYTVVEVGNYSSGMQAYLLRDSHKGVTH